MVLLKDIQIDINQVKRAKNEYQIEHWFSSLFDKLELNYQSQQRLLNGKPDCLIGDKRLCIVIGCSFAFNLKGTYFSTGSFNSNLPSWTSCIIAKAVNDFVQEPIPYSVF